MSKKLLSFLAALFIIIFCAAKDDKVQTIKDYVAKISSETKIEDGFDLIKVEREKRSKYRAYYQNEELVFINENLDIGMRGKSSNRYFFRHNELVYYSEQTILLQDDSLKINTKTMLKSDIYFDSTNVLESARIIGGAIVPLSEIETSSIIEHSKILKELADLNKPVDKK